MFFGWWRSRRRKQILAQPFPLAWQEVLRTNVPVSQLLPEDLVTRLERDTQILVAEQRWVGCRGLKITDEIKVTIASQAALLLLGTDDYCFERVPSILVYPGRFARRGQHASGLEEDEQELLGEAHTRGSIVLSWTDALAGGQDPCDGHNVVLHEFAHHIDALDGDPGGSPPFGNNDSIVLWNQTAELGQQRLLRQLERGEPTVLDPYAAESPAEFFAVATESFFERPESLAEDMPTVFELLSDFYHVDPRPWFAAGRAESFRRHEPMLPHAAVPRPQPIEPADEIPLLPLHSADAYFARALDAYLQGRYEVAWEDWNAVLARQPQDAEALRYRAETLVELEQYAAAEVDARRCLELEPNDREALQTLAIILVEKAEWDEAVAILERLVREDRYDMEALFYRGLALAGQGELLAAIDDFAVVIQRDPGHADAWFQRGECYEQLGLVAEAKRDHQQARRLDSDYPG